MKKLQAYEFVDKFELVMSVKEESLERAYPKIKDISIFKRVLGSQYKNFCLKGNTSERDFANACHNLARRGLILSKKNIETLLGLGE